MGTRRFYTEATGDRGVCVPSALCCRRREASAANTVDGLAPDRHPGAVSWRELLMLGVTLVACSGAVNTPPAAVEPAAPDWPPADADTGISDPKVADLFRRDWALELELDPMWATTVGVHRFDDRVDDNSADGIARRQGIRRGLLEE